jgi:proteasome accessory factor A
VTAVDIQRQYLELVREFAPPAPGEETDLVAAWDEILTDLEREPLSTSDRLDWSAKYRLIEAFRESEGLSPEDPWLRSLDLEYHALDRASGLFFGLQDQGTFRLPFPGFKGNQKSRRQDKIFRNLYFSDSWRACL